MAEHTLDEARCQPVESLLACTCGPAGGRCCACQAALDEHDAVVIGGTYIDREGDGYPIRLGADGGPPPEPYPGQ